jgi:hypothetical protein
MPWPNCRSEESRLQERLTARGAAQRSRCAVRTAKSVRNRIPQPSVNSDGHPCGRAHPLFRACFRSRWIRNFSSLAIVVSLDCPTRTPLVRHRALALVPPEMPWRSLRSSPGRSRLRPLYERRPAVRSSGKSRARVRLTAAASGAGPASPRRSRSAPFSSSA